MTLPPATSLAVTIEGEFEEDEDLRDAYHLDRHPITGEIPLAFDLRTLFSDAGYQRVRIEEPDTHAVVAIRAVVTREMRIPDKKRFFEHIRQLLKRGGYALRKRELSTDRVGDRILVAFPTERFDPERADEINQARATLLAEL